MIRELRDQHQIDFEALWRQACKTSAEAFPPRMVDDTAEQAFWKDVAKRYDETPKLIDYAPQVAEKILSLLGNAKRVLEIGCGTGKFTVPLARCFEEVIAVDMSQDMLEQLHIKLFNQGIHNVRSMQGKWEDVQPGKADGIFLVNAVYRMLDIRKCLAKMNEIARQRVVLVWTQPWSRFERLFRQLGVSGYGVHRDYINLLLILYEMGIDPTLEFLDVEKRVHYNTIEELHRSIRQSVPADKYTPECVETFLTESTTTTGEGVEFQFGQKIAFIHWEPVEFLLI
ncbi:class I SAM-dependent methyltransferase [Alicyclobacillus fastidiosus]|uniref:Methyltransferase domain-containing protein n=1 Tax=Alicyclobacillus fastidiosus TaxID=392011 RepID=A0ABV5AK31_9BACL|nr:class I SAM-dependent methyltransferase [Alicyclobacillus fastidiosus]WEH08364.1 methyltransferase domain-containing protein [Alicyclobacillus fastidiosus]